MIANEITCPNCHELVPGLYGGDHGVVHCGCYYGGRGDVTDATDDFWDTWRYGEDGVLSLIVTARLPQRAISGFVIY